MFVRRKHNKSGTTSIQVVADAGLLSKEYIRDLEEGGYEYILGARKNAADRERGLKRLEKRFLTMSGDATEALERIRQALEAQAAGHD